MIERREGPWQIPLVDGESLSVSLEDYNAYRMGGLSLGEIVDKYKPQVRAY